MSLPGLDSVAGLFGLFVSAFISATIAPGGSEAVLALLVKQAQWPLTLLLWVATFGNTLGALTTWLLGHLTSTKRPLESLSSHYNPKAFQAVRKFGPLVLLFSWMPLIGDALCFAGGWLRLPLLPSLLAITTGKAARYGVVIFLFA